MLDTKRALDEQIRAQKDAIEAIRREALNETKNLKTVIINMDTRLQSTQRELEQAVNVEARLRDTMSAEMREADTRSSNGTMPKPSPQQPSVPVDFVAQIQDIMVRERKETTSLVRQSIGSFFRLSRKQRAKH